MKIFVLLLTALALTGCASTQYTEYAQAQVKIAEANALSQKYRYEALVLLSKDAGDAAKVAAVMSIQGFGQAQQQQALTQPKSNGDTALQWASILVPGVTQIYSINANKELGLANTAASVQNATTMSSSYVEFGKLINSPTVVNQPAPVIVPTRVVQPQVVQVR